MIYELLDTALKCYLSLKDLDEQFGRKYLP